MAKIRSIFGIVALTDVDRTISTSGYREYASIAANKCSPVGNGPQKSTCIICHGSGGSGDICKGSGLFSGPLA